LADGSGRLVDGVMNERDKLHPTIKGYQIWADGLKPIFTARLERESYDDVRPRRLAVQHEEVVVVHARRDRLPAGVFQAMLQHQRVVDEAQLLPIDVRIPRRAAQLVDEFDPVRAFVHRPLTGIDDVVRAEAAITGLVRLADCAHADPDEALARLRVVVPHSRVVGEELLDGSGNRVVKLRIVALEPLSEVRMPFPLE